MTLEEAQIAWLQADTEYKKHLTTTLIEMVEEDQEEVEVLRIVMPTLLLHWDGRITDTNWRTTNFTKVDKWLKVLKNYLRKMKVHTW